MKEVKVAAAVICDSLAEKKSIFATAKGYGEFKGRWEFPGGKIEAGETPRQALVREIEEELAVKITVGDLLDRIEYDYPAFHLSMDCFWCEIAAGEPKLLEAAEGRWLAKEELHSVPWLPADIALLEKIAKHMAAGREENGLK
ncbi:MAG: 8-oxo-dGTP diphosphatase MutT [Firmicutes bacterium]|nr:8-oxo-dGTP diphosphatase MutT [Bacillota bacterium]